MLLELGELLLMCIPRLLALGELLLICQLKLLAFGGLERYQGQRLQVELSTQMLLITIEYLQAQQTLLFQTAMLLLISCVLLAVAVAETELHQAVLVQALLAVAVVFCYSLHKLCLLQQE
jgi:hypothetical protein